MYRILRGKPVEAFHVTPILLNHDGTYRALVMDYGLDPMILQPISVDHLNTLMSSEEIRSIRVMPLSYYQAKEALKLGLFLQNAQATMTWKDAARLLFNQPAQGMTCASFCSEMLYAKKIDTPDELLQLIEEGVNNG